MRKLIQCGSGNYCHFMDKSKTGNCKLDMVSSTSLMTLRDDINDPVYYGDSLAEKNCSKGFDPQKLHPLWMCIEGNSIKLLQNCPKLLWLESLIVNKFRQVCIPKMTMPVHSGSDSVQATFMKLHTWSVTSTHCAHWWEWPTNKVAMALSKQPLNLWWTITWEMIWGADKVF